MLTPRSGAQKTGNLILQNKRACKVLIVSAEYEPKITSGVNRLRFVRAAILEAGGQVEVLSAKNNLYSGNYPTTQEYDETHKIHRGGGISQKLVRWMSTRYFPLFQRLSTPDRYFHWIPRGIKLGQRLADQHQFTHIFVSYPNFSNLAVARAIQQRCDASLVVDFRDPPSIGPKLDSKTNLHRKQLVVDALTNATAISAATRSTAKELGLRFGPMSASITVIPNGYDPEAIAAAPTFDTSVEEVFEIIHIGSFYTIDRDPREAIKAVLALSKTSDQPVRLRLVGDPPSAEVIQWIESNAPHLDIVIEPPCSNAMAIAKAKKASALLLLQGAKFDPQIPAKAYEYLALNRPIWAIVGLQGETAQLLQQYPSNVVMSNYGDSEDTLEGLNRILAMQATPVEVQSLSRVEISKAFLPMFDIHDIT